MAYRTYGRFGIGIGIHNGKVTVDLTGKDSEGNLERVAIDLTSGQGIMLLSDLAAFASEYMRVVVQEQAGIPR